MWRYFIIITISIYLLEQECDSIALEIGHYSNVTLESCGLKSLNTPFNSCFKWHQTIRQELQATNSIKGGGYAQTDEFPFTVFITVSFGGCTASIINSKWIVTAAHCIENSSDIKVYAGFTDFPHDLTKDFIVHEKSFLHTNYTDSYENNKYDIGLIKLKEEIQIRDNANSICLPKALYPELLIETPEVATFTGWGALGDKVSNSHRLKKTQIKLADKFALNGDYITITEINDGYACQGDSGGPLFQYVNGRAVLIGTHVGGGHRIGKGACGRALFYNFASVIHHLKWITDTILNN